MNSRSFTFLLIKQRKAKKNTISTKKMKRKPNQKTNSRSSKRIMKNLKWNESSKLLMFLSNQTISASTQLLNFSSTQGKWNWTTQTRKSEREDRTVNPASQYHMMKSTLQSQMIACILSKWETQWTLGLFLGPSKLLSTKSTTLSMVMLELSKKVAFKYTNNQFRTEMSQAQLKSLSQEYLRHSINSTLKSSLQTQVGFA